MAERRASCDPSRFLFNFSTEFIICRRVEVDLDEANLRATARGYGERPGTFGTTQLQRAEDSIFGFWLLLHTSHSGYGAHLASHCLPPKEAARR